MAVDQSDTGFPMHDKTSRALACMPTGKTSELKGRDGRLGTPHLGAYRFGIQRHAARGAVKTVLLHN